MDKSLNKRKIRPPDAAAPTAGMERQGNWRRRSADVSLIAGAESAGPPEGRPRPRAPTRRAKLSGFRVRRRALGGPPRTPAEGFLLHLLSFFLSGLSLRRAFFLVSAIGLLLDIPPFLSSPFPFSHYHTRTLNLCFLSSPTFAPPLTPTLHFLHLLFHSTKIHPFFHSPVLLTLLFFSSIFSSSPLPSSHINPLPPNTSLVIPPYHHLLFNLLPSFFSSTLSLLPLLLFFLPIYFLLLPLPLSPRHSQTRRSAANNRP